MSVIKPRFWPRMKLYRRNKSPRPAMLRDILANAIEVQTVVEPAKRSAIAITDLGDDKHVITLDYVQEWQPTTVNMFSRFPSPEEKLLRENSLAQLRLELEEEQNKEPGQQDQDLIKSYNAQISQLQYGGSGYLEQAQNTLGTKTSSLFWSLAAPNVPVTLKSTFKLSKNRAFSLRLQRSQAPQGQAEHDFVIEFGNGFTLYAIVIGSDGNKSTFLHYRNMTPKARKVLLDQMDDILDRGRLTASDMAKILDLQKEAAKIKNAAKGRKTTNEENTKLKQLADAEKALRDSKKLLPSQQDQVDTLKNQLYLKEQEFKLQEDAQNLINKPLDITVQFLRGGYVLIQSADSKFVYENQRLTGWRPHGYHDGLPKNSSIHIKSNGGQFALIYGNPKYFSKAVIASQDFALPIAPVVADLNVEDDSDSSSPNCHIAYTLKELKPPLNTSFVNYPGSYQAIVTMSSGGDYTPELYRAQMHIPSAQAPPPDLVWDSQVEGKDDSANSGNGIIDVLLRDDARRSRSVDIHIDNANGKANLPNVLGGLAADVYLHDRSNGNDLYLLTQGRVVATRQPDQRDFNTNPDISCGGQLVITSVGLESFLDVEITARLIGDGKYPNDYIRELAIDGGLTLDQISGIPEGYAGIPRIERGVVGGDPAVQPADGAKYWQWISDVAANHCPGWSLYNDGTQLQLKDDSNRDRPTITYDIPPHVGVDSPLCMRGEVDVYQKLDGYITQVTAVGALNPLRGERYQHTESIPQADDKRFDNSAYYTGVTITEVLPVDDSLMSDKACQLAARRNLGVTPATPNGKTSWFVDCTVDFDPDVFAGDLVRVYGKKCFVDQVQFAALAAGGDSMETMNLTLQLAEDWTA